MGGRSFEIPAACHLGWIVYGVRTQRDVPAETKIRLATYIFSFSWKMLFLTAASYLFIYFFRLSHPDSKTGKRRKRKSQNYGSRRWISPGTDALFLVLLLLPKFVVVVVLAHLLLPRNARSPLYVQRPFDPLSLQLRITERIHTRLPRVGDCYVCRYLAAITSITSAHSFNSLIAHTNGENTQPPG